MHYLKNKWTIRLFGLFIFFIILLNIDVSKILQIWIDTNLLYLSMALALITPQIVMKAWRWQLLMKMQNINYSLKDSSLAYFAGLFMGTITPGRLGDLIKVLYIRNKGHSFGKSFVSVFVDRAFDLLSLILMGYVSMFIFITLFKREIFILSAIFLAIALLFIFFIVDKRTNRRFLRWIYTFFVPEKYKKDIKINFDDFFRDLSLLNVQGLFLAAIITIVVWGIYFVMAYLFALSLNIDIPFLYLATCVSISAIITLIPISISGIGTRDATLIILFSYLGLSKESAIAFSMMILVMYAVNGFIGLVAWLKKPISIAKASDIKEDDG